MQNKSKKCLGAFPPRGAVSSHPVWIWSLLIAYHYFVNISKICLNLRKRLLNLLERTIHNIDAPPEAIYASLQIFFCALCNSRFLDLLIRDLKLKSWTPFLLWFVDVGRINLFDETTSTIRGIQHSRGNRLLSRLLLKEIDSGILQLF